MRTRSRLALASGAEHCLLVSSLGADPRSRVFYNRVKGELELALQNLGYPGSSIFRPLLLLGKRREFRLGEQLAKPLSLLFWGKYKPIQARAAWAVNGSVSLRSLFCGRSNRRHRSR